MNPFADRRRHMVERQIAARGIRSQLVLDAMRSVPREAFIAPELQEFAYEDSALPIERNQTISQPYIIAYMIAALDLEGGERVLEVGTGSGYAAAVLAEIAAEVYTVERDERLANLAEHRLHELGYSNIHVRHGDGTLGWPEAAPFDAILVSVGGPHVPPALKEQLAEGGRLVVPIGAAGLDQRLVRIVRTGPDTYEQDELGAVRFVPLTGADGWHDQEARPHRREEPARPAPARQHDLPELIRGAAEPIPSIDMVDLQPLLERIGEARVVLIGEASHGTSEFYRMRQRITRELIEHCGFRIVAAEADWPDAARIDRYVRQLAAPPEEWTAFARFPTWMWRNHEVREFVDWLHGRNAQLPKEERTGFYGLDLYSLSSSIAAVIAYLETIDPRAAAIARERYACLTPWQSDPQTYGRAALSTTYLGCADQVVAMLKDLLAKRLDYLRRAAGARLLDAIQNAKLVADAERYYRTMYLEPNRSWNLRDRHMFEALQMLIASDLAPGDKAVVWAHNSHVGNALATEMARRGELNIGQLCRTAYRSHAYLIGFGTHTGTVAAASNWNAPMEVKQVLPSRPDSYEQQCHDAGLESFLLHLRQPQRSELRSRLIDPRLERAIGVIYRPETELASHYFEAILPEQFDEYIWFDRTAAVRPLAATDLGGVPDTYPFGL
jgi:protein-L-isoaspartate(D-aspartate) O-methyltransferase